MAQILNHNPEDNPRLNEIYQILLLAGYFRIRIASLKAFDKVIGGIAWCITSSNFEIQVEYNDEMQIGQKIKVSEHICGALLNMKCPYSLQPFQLQGLDVNSIFPVVQWLVKFVYETRFERQKYNREISVLLGKEVLQAQRRGNSSKLPLFTPKRSRINRQIRQVPHSHPIRVYSALLEFNDATANKMYHKLHNILTNRKREWSPMKKSDKEKAKPREEGDELMSYLQDEDNQQQEELSAEGAEEDMGNFGTIASSKFSLSKLEKVIEDNKEQLENALQDVVSEEDEQDNEEYEGNEDKAEKKIGGDKALRILKTQNDKYEQQMKALTTQINNISALEIKVEEERRVLGERKEEIQLSFQQAREKQAEIEEIGTEIEEELDSKELSKKVEEMVERRMRLKQKKIQLKKRGKQQLEELQARRQVVEASMPEIDPEVFQQMLEQADVKKGIFDQKYEQLTVVNQELAILQRKAENYTSAAEIAQYHQKFIELFQAINVLIEQKRSMFSQLTNLEGINRLISNYQEFLNNAQDGVRNSRKKQEKKELADHLKQILAGFETNLGNARATLGKLKSGREAVYSNYMDLILQEREYLKILRVFKVEYENVERFYQ